MDVQRRGRPVERTVTVSPAADGLAQLGILGQQQIAEAGVGESQYLFWRQQVEQVQSAGSSGEQVEQVQSAGPSGEQGVQRPMLGCRKPATLT